MIMFKTCDNQRSESLAQQLNISVLNFCFEHYKFLQ